MNPEKLNRLAQQVRTGGKGSVRRKVKKAHKPTAADDKQLNSTLKKLGVKELGGIEEVNLFKEDGNVIHFASPKVQASMQSNTYVVTGTGELKKLQELLPGIINQIGHDNLVNLKKLAETMGGAQGNSSTKEDDDDVPELVDNFEEAAKQ